MTLGFDSLPGLIVIEHDELVLKVLTDGLAPGLSLTGNYDFWITPTGGKTYTGTFISPKGIQHLLKTWITSGENSNGAYFSMAFQVIVPQMTDKHLLRAALALVRNKQIDQMLTISE